MLDVLRNLFSYFSPVARLERKQADARAAIHKLEEDVEKAIDGILSEKVRLLKKLEKLPASSRDLLRENCNKGFGTLARNSKDRQRAVETLTKAFDGALKTNDHSPFDYLIVLAAKEQSELAGLKATASQVSSALHQSYDRTIAQSQAASAEEAAKKTKAKGKPRKKAVQEQLDEVQETSETEEAEVNLEDLAQPVSAAETGADTASQPEAAAVSETVAADDAPSKDAAA